MLPRETKCWLLNHKPNGRPTLSGGRATFALRTRSIPPIGKNEVLVKTIYLSNDPAQRMWIDPSSSADRLYVAPIEPNQVMASRGIGEVLSSTTQGVKIGDRVLIANIGWSEYAVVSEDKVTILEPLPRGLSDTHYLGALGNTGLTAYYGLVVQSEAARADTIVVSGAAGATGSMVVQIAKGIIGAKRVIGIAGSEEKCRWVERIGADKCVNYKSLSFAKELQDAAPDGVNIYFDCVAGNILDAVLPVMALHGRIAACGSISGYNGANALRLNNWFQVITMRLRIQGFIVLDYYAKAHEARAVLRQAIVDGKLHLDAESETVCPANFEDIPEVWLKLFEGGNQGKLVTHLQ